MDLSVHQEHSQASGNPVRIGDGCATVTGYKLPEPLVHQTGKAGARVPGPKSGYRFGCARRGLQCKRPAEGEVRAADLCCTNFSVKEKDEASPCREWRKGFAECLHSLICRGLKAFYFQTLHWSLNHKPAADAASIDHTSAAIERSVMQKIQLVAVVLTSLLFTRAAQAQYADTVVSYVSGTGFSTGFTNPAAALGEPSRITPGTYGGRGDLFCPPYLASQLVSIGADGSLTVKFGKPVVNHPRNRFGIDFIIFGNAGFIITNAFDPNTFDWIGTPATDGSLFGNNTGTSR